MNNYDNDELLEPWYGYRNAIQKVIIEEGVTIKEFMHL